ncbi:Sporulation domain-containing protein [Legionella geestiana]|uniref:Sporulation domain-containing protein n=1 Tax=Legionella geestiana TaxID=45065 RepID=A0A0W0U4X1_9GAMM|nr:SPOR domain-containing protein [Legionella geestiana]KTD02669.1 Sporulation domain-containing protein [Legionella geestiana]QBS12735.1 SPOR domain-containing protein [Legionella geestiana]QDQ39550.1 SPOR domain-containing protein [Legionella geestiana]STX54797.1 Sporulation domain-containing protein [Legionella geestiana]
MARDYDRRKPARRTASAPGRFFGWLAAFLGGYLTATVFDVASLSGWVNKQLLHDAPQPVMHEARATAAPKPKFEFYTLLARGQTVLPRVPASSSSPSRPAPTPQPQVPVQAAPKPAAPIALEVAKVSPAPARQVPVVESRPVVPPPVAPAAASGTYVVQLAAFRNRQDAERLKASLTLRGMQASVTGVTQQNVTWFRVVIGPYASRDLAMRAQNAAFQTEKVRGMVRRADA